MNTLEQQSSRYSYYNYYSGSGKPNIKLQPCGGPNTTKIVMSLWTKPILHDNSFFFNDFKDFLACWVLAFNQAKKFYPVHIVTDQIGKEILLDKLGLAPDSLTVALDELNQYSANQWALGKLKTYLLQNEPFIQIDHDVFLWQRLPCFAENAEFLAQSPENFWFGDQAIWWYDVERFQQFPFLPKSWEVAYQRKGFQTSLNGGIFGGKNLVLIQEAARDAFAILDHPDNKPVWNSIKHQHFAVTMLEQYNAMRKAEQRHVPVTFLFDEYSPDLEKKVGYSHLMGHYKRELSDEIWIIINNEYLNFIPKIDYAANYLRGLRNIKSKGRIIMADNPTQLPNFNSHTDATNFYLKYWHGSQAGNSNLPLQIGLRYQGTDGREYRSVAAATAEESWIDANQWSNLLGLVEGFKSQLSATLMVEAPLTIDHSADGTTVGLDEASVNAGRLNGQTAQDIIDAARTRQRVHSVDVVIDPNADSIPDTAGASWATSQAGNGLTGMTLYRRTAGGANSVIDNLIPGDYVLVANGDLPDIAYITKTDPDTGSIVLVPVGEDELTAPELQLVQMLTTFGGNRITDLLLALEEFGTDNLHNAQQINNLINAKVDPLAASLQALIDFGDQRAVDLLTLLDDFGPQNLIKIGDVDTRISQFYAARNLMINFHPAKGSPLQGHANYDMPLQAPFSDMSVYAVPDGQASGYHFRNVGTGAETSWIRVG